MNEIIKEIGARVKELRELSDFTTKQIAKNLNIDESQYIQYEEGKIDIPVSILYEIAHIFKVDMGLLLSGEETRMHIFHVTRAGKGRSIEKREGYDCEGVSDRFIHKKAETLLVTLKPNNTSANDTSSPNTSNTFNTSNTPNTSNTSNTPNNSNISNEKPPMNSHPGQEFNYVIEGSLKLYIHNHEIILNKGDSIFFDSDYKHAMEALNNKEAKFLAVII